MSSTFFGLQIAYSGLKASNANLNTTGNNIANVDTEGYSRQQTVTEAATPLRAYESYGCVGAGVDTVSIERVRDSFYDEKYRDNETRLGEAERKEYYMGIMETYFTDDGDNGFKSIFNDMLDAMEEVTKNSSSTSTKAQYVAAVKSLTDYFNNMAGDLQDLQEDINDEIKIQVGQINSIAQEIATINKQINIIELSGSTANELRDKRDLLVDDLSKYVDVEIDETPIYDGAGDETGATRYIVKIAGGQTLVDQNEYNALECVARTSAEKANQTDADGLYDIYWTGTKEELRLDNASMGGSLKALGDLRDGNNGEWFQGSVSSTNPSGESNPKRVENSDGSVAYQVTINTTADYLSNISQCNLSDTGGRIIIGATEYYYDDWTAVTDEDGNISSYTFTLPAVTNGGLQTEDPSRIKAGAEVKMGSQSSYQGIPYYMSQMNEWVRLFADSVNDVFSATGAAYTADGEQADILVTGEMSNTVNASDGTVLEDQFNKDILENNTSGQTYTYDSNKRYYYLTALNVAVSDEIAADADLLGSRADASDGVEECDNVYTVMSNLQDKSKLSFRGYNASGFLEAVLSDVALNTSNARTFTDSYTNLEKSLDNQRTSESGVDSDEEALNLVKYENAYTLASKMIQVFSEIYDRLILETGV